MSTSHTITATEASRNFSELLHRVCYGGEAFVIKKGNRVMAQIAPVAVKEDPPARKKKKSPRREEEARLLAQMPPQEAEYFRALMEQMAGVD